MAVLTCPTCGANVDVASYLALHRWPAVYPDDAATAIVPCEQGHPLTVKVVRIDDNPVIESGAAQPLAGRDHSRIVRMDY